MIRHIWSVLCEKSIIDHDTNNISLVNIFEQFTIMADPIPDGILPITAELVTLWARDKDMAPSTSKQRLSIIDPEENIIKEIIMDIDLTKASHLRCRAILKGLPVSKSGDYLFRIEYLGDQDNWISVALVPLSISFEPPSQQ
jgi:hypothetical protein